MSVPYVAHLWDRSKIWSFQLVDVMVEFVRMEDKLACFDLDCQLNLTEGSLLKHYINQNISSAPIQPVFYLHNFHYSWIYQALEL